MSRRTYLAVVLVLFSRKWLALRNIDTFYGNNSYLTIRDNTMGSSIRYTDGFKQ